MYRFALVFVLFFVALFASQLTMVQPQADGVADNTSPVQERLVVFEMFSRFT